MENDELRMLLDFPLITAQKDKETVVYSGILHAGGQDHTVYVSTIAKDGVLHFSPSIDLGLPTNGTSIAEFLSAMTAVFEIQALKIQPKNLTGMYRKILYEYSEFTKFHINVETCKLSSDLSYVEVLMQDEGKRLHSIRINVDYNEAVDIFTVAEIDLPLTSTDVVKKGSSLIEVYDWFLVTLERLQGYFNTIDELDASATILDPEKPLRKHRHRRIWLDHNLSLVVTFDPFNAFARPDLKFLGPESAVERYRNRLNEKLEDWYGSQGVLQCILNVLGIESFPFRPEECCELLVEQGDCCICFAPRCNEKLPEVVCSNRSCENFYHIECLYEWLISSNSKRIFNQIHGLCPNCEKPISCSLPEAVQ